MISDDQIEIINLFDILIKDMYNILVKILHEDLPKAKIDVVKKMKKMKMIKNKMQLEQQVYSKKKPLISNEALNSINIPKKDFEELKNKVKNMSQDLEKIKKSNDDLSEKFENLSKELGVENADFEEKLSKVNKKNEGKIADLEKEIDNIKINSINHFAFSRKLLIIFH